MELFHVNNMTMRPDSPHPKQAFFGVVWYPYQLGPPMGNPDISPMYPIFMGYYGL